MNTLQIAQSIVVVSFAALAILLTWLYRIIRAEKRPNSDVGYGNYIAEVRVHQNSFSTVVYRERHANPQSGRRLTKLRAAEYMTTDAGKALPENAHVVVDVYKAEKSAGNVYAIWPAAGTNLAF